MSAPTPTTPGEIAFAQYLDSRGIPYVFEKEWGHTGSKPDFLLQADKEYVCEVKDLDPIELNPQGVWFDPYSWVRQEIIDAKKKFKGFKDYPCCVVLFNTGNPRVDLRNSHLMLGAMYGDFGWRIPFDPATGGTQPDQVEEGFQQGRGMVIKRTIVENTRISAIISLRYIAIGKARLQHYVNQLKTDKKGIEAAVYLYEQLEKSPPPFDTKEFGLGVSVWENAFAATPILRELFCGPFDEVWGVDGEYQKCLFAGDGLREYVDLTERK